MPNLEQQDIAAIKAIAILISDYPEEVKSLLSKEGVNITKIKDKYHLTEIVNKYLIDSPDFRDNMQFLLIEKSKLASFGFDGLAQSDLYYNQTGGAGSDPLTAVANAIGSVFGTIGTAIGKIGEGKERETQEQLSRDALMSQVLQYEGEKQQTATKQILIYGGIALGILIIGGLIIYAKVKRKRK